MTLWALRSGSRLTAPGRHDRSRCGRKGRFTAQRLTFQGLTGRRCFTRQRGPVLFLLNEVGYFMCEQTTIVQRQQGCSSRCMNDTSLSEGIRLECASLGSNGRSAPNRYGPRRLSGGRAYRLTHIVRQGELLARNVLRHRLFGVRCWDDFFISGGGPALHGCTGACCGRFVGTRNGQLRL